MKKTVIAKLRSNSGASLMAALLFFIMAATVGSLVLAAATASSGRLAGVKRNEQAHYAVNSAAGMLSELIQEKKVIIRLTMEKPEGDPGSPTVEYLDPKDGTTVIDPSNVVLAGLIKSIYTNPIGYGDPFPTRNNIFSASQDVSVTVDGYTDLSVTAKASMNSSLDLLVEITPADTSVSGSFAPVKMRFAAVVEAKETIKEHDMKNTSNKDGDSRVTTYQKTYTISWTNPVFE